MGEFKVYEVNVGANGWPEVDKVISNLRQRMASFHGNMRGVKLDDIQVQAFQALGVALNDVIDEYARDRRKYSLLVESEENIKEYWAKAEVRLVMYNARISQLEDQLVEMTRNRDVIYNDLVTAHDKNHRLDYEKRGYMEREKGHHNLTNAHEDEMLKLRDEFAKQGQFFSDIMNQIADIEAKYSDMASPTGGHDVVEVIKKVLKDYDLVMAKPTATESPIIDPVEAAAPFHPGHDLHSLMPGTIPESFKGLRGFKPNDY